MDISSLTGLTLITIQFFRLQRRVIVTNCCPHVFLVCNARFWYVPTACCLGTRDSGCVLDQQCYWSSEPSAIADKDEWLEYDLVSAQTAFAARHI